MMLFEELGFVVNAFLQTLAQPLKKVKREA
jgi:hypothetical protein